MSVEVMELFNIFSKTYTKEEAQTIVKDIETLINDHKLELATKGDLRETELKLTKEIKETELRLTKEIEQVKSGVIKWVVGWVAGLLIAYTGVIVTVLSLLK
ncbi:MAG: hypothetical protein AB1611_19280 [bacterium]